MDFFTLFQGSPVVNPLDALVISFPDFTPRIGIPEAFKDFVAPTISSTTLAPQISQNTKIPKESFLISVTTSSSKFLRYAEL